MVEKQGKKLWRKAVKRVQKRHGRVAGDLPQSDDRPLYWARLQATAVLRQWEPRFALSIDERDALITSFDKASRGMTSIRFQPGNPVKRVIVSGFDPYTLDGGDDGSAQGAAGNNIRHGNPSGAVALALDGTTHRAKNGTRQVVQAYMLPVNYTEFAAGYLEDTVGPLMKARPNRRVDASLTISQAGGSEFHLEQWNARYHGVSPGNDLSQPCPRVDGTPQLAINNHGCNSEIPRRWGAPLGFNLDEPPQWITASMPVGRMIRANTGRNVPRPPVIPGLTLRSPSVSSGTPTTPSSPIAPRRNEKAETRPHRPIRLLILQYHLTRTHVRTAVVGATISRTRAPTATPDCGSTSAWISPPDTSTPPGCSTSTKATYSSPATAPSMPGAMQLSRRR